MRLFIQGFPIFLFFKTFWNFKWVNMDHCRGISSEWLLEHHIRCQLILWENFLLSWSCQKYSCLIHGRFPNPAKKIPLAQVTTLPHFSPLEVFTHISSIHSPGPLWRWWLYKFLLWQIPPWGHIMDVDGENASCQDYNPLRMCSLRVWKLSNAF